MQACRPAASSSFLDVSFPSSEILAKSSLVSKTGHRSSSSSSPSPGSLEASKLPTGCPLLLGLQSPPTCAIDASNRLQELLHEHLLAPVQERLSVWMTAERERKRKLLEMKKTGEGEMVTHGKDSSPVSAKQEESARCPSAPESQINADHQSETEAVAGGKAKGNNGSESSPTSSPRLPRVSPSMSVDRHPVEGPVAEEEDTGAAEESLPRQAEGGMKQKDAVGAAGGEEEGHVATVKERDEDELSVDYGSSPRTPSGKADDERFTSSLGEDEGKHPEVLHTPSPRPSESVPDSDTKTPSSVPTRDPMKGTAAEGNVKEEEASDGGGGSPAGTQKAEKNDAAAVSDTSPCARSERKCSSREPSVPSSLVAESSTSPPSSSSSSSPPKKSGTEQEEQTAEFSPQPPWLTIPVPPASFWAEVLRLLSQIYEGMTSPNDQISSSFFRARLGLPPPMLRLLTAAACGVLKTLVLSPVSRTSLRRMLLRKQGQRVRTASGGAARPSCTDSDKRTSRGEEENGERRSDGIDCEKEGRDVGRDSREEWLSGGTASVDAAREVIRLLGLEGPVLEILSKFHGEKKGSRGNETMPRKREDPGEAGENSCANRKAEEDLEGKEKPNLKKQPHEESQDMLGDGVDAPDQEQADRPDEEKAAKESNGSAQEDQPGVPESPEKEDKNREGSGEVAMPSTHLETEPSTVGPAVGLFSASPAAEKASAPLCLSFSLQPESSHLLSDPVGSAGLSLYRGSLLLLLVMKTLRRLAVLEELGSQLVGEGACEVLVSMLLEVPVWGNRGVNLNDLTEGIRGSGSEEERITARGWKVKVEAFKGLVVLVSHVAGMERLLGWVSRQA